VATAVAAALVIHRRIPWIPPAYLGALIGLPVVAWCVWRRRALARWWRWCGSSVAVIGFVALLPVPWMTVHGDDPPGTAWQLDGKLVLDGRRVDPPGTWYWLTAGRPPIVVEVVESWLGGGPPVRDLRGGPAAKRPTVVEPAAASVGLRLAGRPVPDTDVDAAIGAPWLGALPVSWYRNLSLGASHGLMVALVSYVDGSGVDLAAGRSIAGTGGISADGTVRPITGLVAKATAARRIGADVLLYPATQRAELSTFDAGPMRLIPVYTLTEAVAALAVPHV
jgi:hypothetical protein